MTIYDIFLKEPQKPFTYNLNVIGIFVSSFCRLSDFGTTHLDLFGFGKGFKTFIGSNTNLCLTLLLNKFIHLGT